ncbi:MAG: AraC family transcriptional regulator [Cyanobacteria bacterium P01_F01_bin.150]
MLRPGLELFVQVALFHERFILETEFRSLAPFSLGFFVSGDSRGIVKGLREDLNFSSGQSSFSAVSDATGVVEYCVGKPVIFLSISMDTEVLYKFLDGHIGLLPRQFQQFMEGKDRAPCVQTSWMTATTKMAVQQALNCPYQGLTKRLYLESKAIEIFTYFLDQLSSDLEKTSQKPFLKPADIERIHQAKEILVDNLTHPPSLASLAKSVDLNDHKLKIGFRQVFGTTAFGYLREHRMYHARELLVTRALSVVEISRAVGYASETSFSAAFKEKFGVPPTVYRASNF